MDEYFCPNCGAILNEQWGFNPEVSTWTCTECGKLLMDDEIYDGDNYEGVAWFCDNCGALLNKQSGFTDSYSSWTCTECYHSNPINEDVIYDSEKEINKGCCPDCRENLEDQFGCYPEGCQTCYCGKDMDWNVKSQSLNADGIVYGIIPHSESSIILYRKIGYEGSEFKICVLNVDKYLGLKKVEKNNKNDAERIIEICKNQYAEAKIAYQTLAVYWRRVSSAIDGQTISYAVEHRSEFE